MFSGIPGFSEDSKAIQLRRYLRRLLAVRTSIINTEEKILTEGELKVNGESQASVIKNSLLRDDHFKRKDGSTMPDDFADLISHMLEFNPEHRWSYDQLILHPVFQHIRREKIPKLPVFINNMPIIDNIGLVWNASGGNEKMRRILFSWLNEDVHVKLRFSDNVLYLTYQLVDMFMMKLQTNSQNKKIIEAMKGVGCACMHIASKIYEYDTGIIEDYAFLCGKPYTPDMLAQLERIILERLDGNIIIPSLFTYLIHKRGIQHVTDRRKYIDMYLKTDIYSKPFKSYL